MGPLQQLRAGRLPLRIIQLVIGLTIFGASMAMLIRANLGVIPWDVFHLGVSKHVPLTFGMVTILTGVAVLLMWIPLKQWPGLGTLANTVLVGIAADATLYVLPEQHDLPAQIGLAAAGVVLNGMATAMYIGTQLGPGSRDGLMTGLAAKTGLSIRLVRTGIEVVVLVTGWLLGGAVGVVTFLFALVIGPITQAMLPWFIVRLPHPPTAPEVTAQTP